MAQNDRESLALSSTDEDLFADYLDAIATTSDAIQQNGGGGPPGKEAEHDQEEAKQAPTSTPSQHSGAAAAFTFDFIYTQASAQVERQMKKQKHLKLLPLVQKKYAEDNLSVLRSYMESVKEVLEEQYDQNQSQLVSMLKETIRKEYQDGFQSMMFGCDEQLSFLLKDDDDNFDEISFKDSIQRLIDQCAEGDSEAQRDS